MSSWVENIGKNKSKYWRAVKAAENTLHITNLENTDERVFATAAAEPLFGARYLLAVEYWKTGNREKAIRNALQIVKFDKRDRMAVRGLVSSWLLIDNRNDEAKIFLENLDKDFIASVNYNRAAMFYRNGMKDEAEKALRIAFMRNPYVYEYLTREKLLPEKFPKVKRVGSEEEAIKYARLGIKIWNKSEMIKWLVECRERFDIEKLGDSLQK